MPMQAPSAIIPDQRWPITVATSHPHRRYHMWSDGKILPIISGGAGDDDPPAPPAPTFTQADIDRIAAREKAQGRNAAANELAEQLGMSPDEAKKALARLAEIDAKDKSDTQKATEAATAAAERLAATEAKLVAAERAGQLQIALLTKGAKPDRLAALLAIANTGGTEFDAATEADRIAETVPELFTTKESGDGDDKESGDADDKKSGDVKQTRGGSRTNTGKTGYDPNEAAKARIEARNKPWSTSR